jgi:predicted Rossmann fold flavoprotein
VLDATARRHVDGLAGLSMPVVMNCGGASFEEQMLVTHAGVSGPAALQVSLYWRPGAVVSVDLLPDATPDEAIGWLRQMQARRPRADVKTVLAERLPKRAAERFCARCQISERPLAHQTRGALEALCRGLKCWQFTPLGTVGYRTAEVTRGGVDTRELSSKTMECEKTPGLYFIGEVVDVTGWLGGYNFQWAWSSGWVAGQSV